MTDLAMREWIDNADYHSLLARWRNAPSGSPWFQGEIGEYYTEAMKRKQADTPHTEQVAASKAIGW